MLFFNLTCDSNILMFAYMFLYNTSLILLFWTLFTTILTKFKTLHSFNSFHFNSFHLLVLTILLFSMAGVPPFIGFFSKLFILTLLVNNSFFLLYFLFFVILLIGLYFYIQNIRFLHSTNPGDISTPFVFNERVNLSYFYFGLWLLSILIFGIFYVDDILLFFTWLLF